MTGLCDAAILGGPLLLAISVWSLAGWILTGSPLAEVSNAYGQGAQLHALGAYDADITTPVSLRGLLAVFAVEPALPVAALLGGSIAVLRRDTRPIAAVCIFLPMLVFMYWGWTTGTVLRSLRYFITAVPLTVLLSGFVLAACSPRAGERVRREAGEGMRTLRSGRFAVSSLVSWRWTQRLLQAATAACLVAGLGLAGVTSGAALQTRMLNAGEVGHFNALPAKLGWHASQEARSRAAMRFDTDREVARYLDSLELQRGAVLVDDFSGWAVVVNSVRPDHFVITSDRDFQQILADPAGSGVIYVLVTSPHAGGLSSLDAVSRAYPNLYENGAGLGQLVREFDQTGDLGSTWRLYRLTSSSIPRNSSG
jgi:hypothetical protein